MSQGKVKASKVKVFAPPEGTGSLDGNFHVYVFDVFNGSFAAGRSFDTVEKAASFQRHEQERIYTEQEATPELFDLPFISSDPELITRVENDAAYKQKLATELNSDARNRAKRR